VVRIPTEVEVFLNGVPLPYELSSTVIHRGATSKSGHYISEVFEPSRTVVRYDDSNLTVHRQHYDNGVYVAVYKPVQIIGTNCIV
jgi:ubiquitin C-terminal hydrolase